MPRRRTITLHQQLCKVFQIVEVGGNETPIEAIWGIGIVNWQKEGRIIDRPLLEIRVELELDDVRGGLIRIRLTTSKPICDLRPYEELGCNGLPQLSDLIRREYKGRRIMRACPPFRRKSYEPILSPAASRLDSEGCYAPNSPQSQNDSNPARLTVTDQWVLFASPRSQHIVLQDIERLREVAEDPVKPIGGVAERLVTEPLKITSADSWAPLDDRIGGSTSGSAPPEPPDSSFDVFFPQPFNDDQIGIVRGLKRADGLVVQGPAGTGKTHTIANHSH